MTSGDSVQIILFLRPEFGIRTDRKVPNRWRDPQRAEDVGTYEIELGVSSAGNAQCKWQSLFREGRTIERYKHSMKHGDSLSANGLFGWLYRDEVVDSLYTGAVPYAEQ